MHMYIHSTGIRVYDSICAYTNTLLWCSYHGEGESNMAIVDVEIPSGYVYVQYSDFRGVIERQETRGSNAIFYISSVSIC